VNESGGIVVPPDCFIKDEWMAVQITEIDSSRLADYASIPCRVRVTSCFAPELVQAGLGGILLREVPVEQPYTKDYDSYGELPTDWSAKFDISRWGFFLALNGGHPVGAAAVAFGTSGLLEDRTDLSVLWDIRVKPEVRGAGIPLFRYAVQWSRARGCNQMKIETQNINVPACCFYQRMGARLGEIRLFGYAAVPAVAHEVMLCWYLDL
jgi:GNAT superfamily N-acetyltransferase